MPRLFHRPPQYRRRKTSAIVSFFGRSIYRPVEHKTEHFEKDRIIAIGSRAQEILRPYLATDELFCFSPAESLRRTLQCRSALIMFASFPTAKVNL